MPSVTNIASQAEYNAVKEQAKACLGLVVHFSASWCEPCKAVTAELEKAAATYDGNVLFAEVNCEEPGDICESEGVDLTPFVIFFRTTQGEVKEMERVAEVAGAKVDQIEMNLVSLYGEKGAHGVQQKDFASLNDYLKYLTGRKGVVMFITGSPSRPRCGFTGRLCELVHELGVPFIYYDVMASNEVCEGLKTYANWPTYPQVYVDGELIGGWDICRELHEGGELKSALKH